MLQIAKIFAVSLLPSSLLFNPNSNPPILSNPVVLTHSSKNLNPPTLITQNTVTSGQQVNYNGRNYSIPWVTWKEGNNTRYGVADILASQSWGFDLLNTSNPNQQPIRWFSSQANFLNARFKTPYRYIDITPLIQQRKGILQLQGNTLNLTLPPSEISFGESINTPQGKRHTFTLTQPALWNLSNNGQQAILTIEGKATQALLDQFKPIIPDTILTPVDRDDLSLSTPTISPTPTPTITPTITPTATPTITPTPIIPPFTIESTANQTKITFNLTDANGIKITTKSNPFQIVVELRPDAFLTREITYLTGVTWFQKYVSLNSTGIIPTPNTIPPNLFGVTGVEINLKTSRLFLRPFTANPNSLTGTSPLVTMGKNNGMIAGINGGFFNRNNQLPLGAIKREGKWLSSPILNRGAMAWDNQGNVQFSRLSLQETLTTDQGNQLAILYLNSGYIQSGIARYTTEWGQNYITLSDNEVIFTVINNQITQQTIATQAGKDSLVIPSNGYLLVFRKSTPDLIAKLPINSQLQLIQTTTPPEMNNYPNIIAGGPLLMVNNQIVLDGKAEQFTPAFIGQTASRSAVILTQRGTLMLVASHNRAGGKGPSLIEWSQILRNLGAVSALNLDGGSSTGLYLGGNLVDRSPLTAAKVHNGLGLFDR